MLLKSIALGLAILALGSTVPTAPAHAVPRAFTLEDFLKWRTAGQGQISPDGSRIIYSRERIDELKDDYDGVLWMMNRDRGEDRFLLDGHNLRWSPSGDRVAYTARTDSGYQIFVRWMTGRTATAQISHDAASPSGLQWSPDGRQIAFLGAVASPGADIPIQLPPRPPGAKWSPNPVVIDTLHYRTMTGDVRTRVSQIFVISADGGVARQVTHEPQGVGARYAGIGQGGPLQWTPDGRAIVFDGGQAKDDMNGAARSGIDRVDLTTGAVRKLTNTPGFWDNPRVSPDGRWIAYEGYADLKSTFPVVELHIMHPDGSGDHVLLRDAPDRIYQLFWAPDSKGLYWNANEKGEIQVHYIDVSGRDRTVVGGHQELHLTSMSRNGLAVATRMDPVSSGDVVLIDLNSGRTTPLTDMNAELRRQVAWSVPEELWVSAKDGTRIQGWLFKPPDFDPGKRYPMILNIHGGPHEMTGWGLDLRNQLFAAKGYLVLTANPRGSTGYGAAFANAIDNIFPSDLDAGDLLATVDGVAAKGDVDPARLYLMGCSGGGALAAWILGHTDRFAAGAVMCPVTDWISFAGSSDVTLWGETQFEKPFWTDPKPWLEHSPLMYAGRVRTPTLVIVGERDYRTPVGQAESFYRALKIEGVDTKLIIFPEESHQPWSGSPSDFMRVQLYLESWFGSHKKPL